MKWATIRRIQKGSNLRDIEAVKKRLKEIRSKPKSVYHGYLKAGYIQVHYDPSRASRGRYDIVVYKPLEPHGLIECGNCELSFFALDDDYLCPECRADLNKKGGGS